MLLSFRKKKVPIKIVRHCKMIDERTYGIYENDRLVRVGQHLQSLEGWLDWLENIQITIITQ